MSIAVISEQENAGEIVVAASIFLELGYVSIIPVSKYKDIREEFSFSLKAFGLRERHSHWVPELYAKQIVEPRQKMSLNYMFWLALDEQGATRIRKIFARQGKSPDEFSYKAVAVCKVNLLEPPITPLPNTNTSPNFWRSITKELSSIYHSQTYTYDEYQEILEKRMPLTPEEKELYSWFNSLRKSLAPWRDTILKIVFDRL